MFLWIILWAPPLTAKPSKKEKYFNFIVAQLEQVRLSLSSVKAQGQLLLVSNTYPNSRLLLHKGKELELYAGDYLFPGPISYQRSFHPLPLKLLSALMTGEQIIPALSTLGYTINPEKKELILLNKTIFYVMGEVRQRGDAQLWIDKNSYKPFKVLIQGKRNLWEVVFTYNDDILSGWFPATISISAHMKQTPYLFFSVESATLK